MLNLKRFAIFSLKGLDLNSGIDEKSSYRLQHTLSRLEALGYGYKVVKGSYKGTLETSILVVCDDDTKLQWVRNTAFQDGQESILIVDEYRRAYLEYNTIGANINHIQGNFKATKLESIGNFRSITAIEASNLDNWTLDGVDYYACV